MALAASFGEAAIDWLMRVLAESQQRRARRPLARTLAEVAREHPERLLPWLSDERWYVVRNVVHILSWIGGDDVAAYVRPAMKHHDVRVRREVVAALARATPAVARPMLLGMLADAGSRLFTTLLQQLSAAPDAAVAQRLRELLRDERFVDRAEDERRAVFLALSAQGDAALEALEDEFDRGGLLARGLDGHWQSVALCAARIGTPEAQALLERGRRSRKAGVRKACEIAFASLETRRG